MIGVVRYVNNMAAAVGNRQVMCFLLIGIVLCDSGVPVYNGQRRLIFVKTLRLYSLNAIFTIDHRKQLHKTDNLEIYEQVWHHA